MTLNFFLRHGLATMTIGVLALSAASRVEAQTVLFSDTFDRPNNLNISASSTGMSGTAAPMTYWESDLLPTPNNDNLSQITNNMLGLATGPNASVVALQSHNFIDSQILADGGFRISMDMQKLTSGQATVDNYCGFGAGISSNELANLDLDYNSSAGPRGRFSNAAYTGVADFYTCWTMNGGGDVQIFFQGAAVDTQFDMNVGTTAGVVHNLRADFYPAGFGAGDNVNVFVYIDNTLVVNTNFTWHDANANYVVASARIDAGFLADNLLVQTIAVANAPRVWVGDGSGNAWDTNSLNWKNSVSGAPAKFSDGKSVTFDDSTANTNVNVAGIVSPASLTLNNTLNNYTLSGVGSIAGTGGLTKSGNGTLTLSQSNSFSGGTTLNLGRLRVGNNNALGTGPLVLSGGTISSDSGTARVLANAVTIATATTLGDAANNGTLTFNGPLDFNGAGRTITVNYNSTVVFAGGAGNGIVGSKQGAGTLILKGLVDYTGSSDVQDGTLIYDGATVTSTDRVIADAGAVNGIARMVVTNGASVTVTTSAGNLRAGRFASAGSNYVDLAGLYLLPNATSANGYLTLQGTAAYSEVTFWPGGDFSARAVTNNNGPGVGNTVFKFNGGILRARNDNPNFFEGLSQALVQSGGANIDDGGFNITINQNLLAGGGGGGLNKIGSGTLTLAGANTYTGSTVVSNGTLSVTGSLQGGGAVNVAGGTLGGNGLVSGPVTVQPAGTLSPGASVGTLTVSGNLTLAGSALLEVDKSLGSTNDRVNVGGTLTYSGGGTVTIVNLGPAYAAGDNFKFFNKALSNGGAVTLSPPTPGSGLAWTNKLAVDGSVGIVSTAIVGTPADLIALTLSAGMLSPGFNSNILSYAASVIYTNSTVTLTPTSANPSATIRVICNGVTNLVASGVPGSPVSLKPGTNAVDVQVTAPDDSITKDYVVMFTRIQPNIIVILADDQGFSDWSCYGSEINTPNLDQMAATGLRYRQFYNCARCSPTRCAILTGLYTAQVAADPYAALPNLRNDDNVTTAELLRANGYRTYMSGKWHLGGGAYLPESRGFDQVFRYVNGNDHSEDTWDTNRYTFVSSNGELTNRIYGAGQFYQPDAIGDYSLDFINNDLVTHASDKPFFLYLAFGSAHFPIQAPKSWVDTNNPVYANGWDYIRNWRYTNMLAMGIIDPHYGLSPNDGTPPWSSVPAEQILPWNSLTSDRQADLARRMAIYAAMIQKMDANIGRVVQRLRDLGQLDNTLIFAVSDNGGNYEGGVYGLTGGVSDATPLTGTALDNMGLSGQPVIYLGGGWAHVSNTPFRLFKHFNHGGGNRTPLIVHWPQGITRTNQWDDQVGHLIDIMATIVDVTGVSYPTQFNNHVVLPLEGMSLKPSFTSSNDVSRTLGFEHESNRAWISGSWKFVTKNYDLITGTSPANELELYDLSKDGSEMTNLAASQPVLLQQMVTNWNAWAIRVGVPNRIVNTSVFALQFTPPAGTNDLFVDSFNRPNNTNIDSSPAGMWGSRVPPLGANAAYYEGYEGSGDPTSIEIVSSNLQMAVGSGMSENGIMHNFVGQDIVDAGGFSVEMNVQEINTSTSDSANRFAGFGVGLSQTEAAAGGDVGDATGILFRGKEGNANLGVSDFFVELDIDGNVKVWHDGILLDTVPVGQNYGVLTASFACTGFTTNDTVTVTVFFNGQQVDINTADANSMSRTFQWDRNDSNYIGLSARASNYVRLDNLAIRKLPVSDNLAVNYAMIHGLSGTNAALNADPDGDGVSNFGEWAFGGDPTAFDPMIASLKGTLMTVTHDFQFDYQQLINAANSGVNYRYFTSGDLSTWTEVTPIEVNAMSNEDLPGYEIVTMQLPAASIVDKNKLFLRVLAEPAH